jgi:hypothetical protein
MPEVLSAQLGFLLARQKHRSEMRFEIVEVEGGPRLDNDNGPDHVAVPRMGSKGVLDLR